ncbi:N-acetylneuraminate synthase family protein [bacterium]|nr:N-acetylneuraminate synthase family protein [bacterium]UNM08647.1 MAG: N-acetylneuraminate synthase family protein [Planctomycetales bacterium]
MVIDNHRPVYIIAEAGINHGGDMRVAAEMVRIAAAAGANAVKFQSFTASGLAHDSLAADQHAFFSKYELGRREHAELNELCRSEGIVFLSTPFDTDMLALLEELHVPAYKVASCDLTNLPFIAAIASRRKPMYISTGMGSMDEVWRAYETAIEHGCPQVVMLQCTTQYPTPYPQVNLRSMLAISDEVGCDVGFSDHSIGNWCCFAAVGMGASVIEKHFCLDKSVAGPDIPGSCSPEELTDLVQGIRAIEQAMGRRVKQMQESEEQIAGIARRSAFYACDLGAGHVLCEQDLKFLRPGTGLAPQAAMQLLGRELRMSVRNGAQVKSADFHMMEGEAGSEPAEHALQRDVLGADA